MLSERISNTPRIHDVEQHNGIRLTNVSFSCDDRDIIKDISLDICEKRVAFIGSNGAGKSTLLRMINGLVQPAAGHVCVHGRSETVGRSTGALTQVAGMVFQNPDHQIIFPTPLEELSFTLTQRGIGRAEAKAKALAFLSDYGLSHLAERPIHVLSEGQKQLICILSILIGQPAVLLFDEPFSNLDLFVKEFLLSRIMKLEQQVVMVSHDLDAIVNFDRIIWIENGAVRGDGNFQQIVPTYKAAQIARAASADEGAI